MKKSKIPTFKHAGKSIYESLVLTGFFESVRDVKECLKNGLVVNFNTGKMITRFDHCLNQGDKITIENDKSYEVV